MIRISFRFRPLFTEHSTAQPVIGWPAPGGITEQQATSFCEARIVNSTYIGDACASKLRTDTATRNIIEGCIADIQARATMSSIILAYKVFFT